MKAFHGASIFNYSAFYLTLEAASTQIEASLGIRTRAEAAKLGADGDPGGKDVPRPVHDVDGGRLAVGTGAWASHPRAVLHAGRVVEGGLAGEVVGPDGQLVVLGVPVGVVRDPVFADVDGRACRREATAVHLDDVHVAGPVCEPRDGEVADRRRRRRRRLLDARVSCRRADVVERAAEVVAQHARGRADGRWPVGVDRRSSNNGSLSRRAAAEDGEQGDTQQPLHVRLKVKEM
ncbi:hypothetical protein B0T26DRAFT_699704 [Lasiosphaeria miniovina]|uniref:Uncharacterized protein n=1 Tax=Lasiosphaeria miniovina TaxID=1954250 RepID=A0AA40DYV6_9PEZI|nr:uncharacterized protein B0T26DRAFT_699704 [Lasiosphaeria miniovina]KAK0721564.1 hypothetical protein B0T26DRAFT_699704 [Lasiosphaeria miniovina]